MRVGDDRTDALQIGVIGAGDCDEEIARCAEAVGRAIARRGAVLVCGGMGGIMAAACRGARSEGGTALGILPGNDPHEGNPYLTAAVATGFGQGRNYLIPRSSDGVVAIAGGWGTLSEIGFCRKLGLPLVGVRTWTLDGSFPVLEEGEEAVRLLFEELLG